MINANSRLNEVELMNYNVSKSPTIISKRQRPAKSSTKTIQLGLRFNAAKYRYATNDSDGTLAILSSVIEFFSPTGNHTHSDLSMIDVREELITSYPLITFTEPGGALAGNLVVFKNLANKEPM